LKGFSLFGVIPCFERIPMRGVVMTETQIAREALPMDKTPASIEVPMIEGTYTQGSLKVSSWQTQRSCLKSTVIMMLFLGMKY
jgi:hypothetical protein